MFNYLFPKRRCPNICLSKTRISKTEMSKKIIECPTIRRTQFRPSVVPFLQRKNDHDELNFVRPSCFKRKWRQWADGRISFRPSIFPWEKKDGNEPTDESWTTNLVSSVRRVTLKKKRQWYSSSVCLLTDRISGGSIFDKRMAWFVRFYFWFRFFQRWTNENSYVRPTSFPGDLFPFFFFSLKIICPTKIWSLVTDEKFTTNVVRPPFLKEKKFLRRTDELDFVRPSYDSGKK